MIGQKNYTLHHVDAVVNDRTQYGSQLLTKVFKPLLGSPHWISQGHLLWKMTYNVFSGTLNPTRSWKSRLFGLSCVQCCFFT